jgi:hypothetical protein
MLMRAKRFNYLLQIRVEDEQKRDLDDTAQRFSTTPAALAGSPESGAQHT